MASTSNKSDRLPLVFRPVNLNESAHTLATMDSRTSYDVLPRPAFRPEHTTIVLDTKDTYVRQETTDDD